MGIELTLRNALEPWHVMGEEGAAGGTVRYVDSSLERIEVKVTGLNDSRHVVTVNGRALPLQPTGTRRRVRVRRALPGLAAAVGAAPDDRRACAAHLRHRRHLDAALAGRLPVPRGAPGRPQLRHLPGQRLRGREPAPGALLPHRPHAGADAAPPAPAAAEPRVPVHARPARCACPAPPTLPHGPACSQPSRCRFAACRRAGRRRGRTRCCRRALPRRRRRLRRAARRPRRPLRDAAGSASPRRCRRRPPAPTIADDLRPPRRPGRRSRSATTASPTTSTPTPSGAAQRALVAGPVAAADRARRLGAHRGRRGAARARCSSACWPTSTARSSCCTKACCRRRWCCATPATCGRCIGVRAAGRPAPAHRRLRPRARPRRPLVGGGAAHAGPVGPGLPAGEPADHLAPVPRGLPRAARAAPRRTYRACSTRWSRRAQARWSPAAAHAAHRAADARARTTRPTSSTPTWRATSACRWSRAAT